MRWLWITWSSKAHAINVEKVDAKRQIAKQIRISSSLEPAIYATRKVTWRRIALKKKMQASRDESRQLKERCGWSEC